MPPAYESQNTPPSITALFLVVFDQKIGYKISWQRTLDSISTDGVEYKSLPSGVHNVQQDLIYFTQDGHAGLSAFVRRIAGETDRNARFAAVGVFVPLIPGRLGKAWLHASGLRELAETCIDNLDDHNALEEYWNTHMKESSEDGSHAPMSPQVDATPYLSNDDKRSSGPSIPGSTEAKMPELSPEHPALSMHDFLNAFGPLIFPLYRAALVRKRILLLGSAPVQRMCDFVYSLSIFSCIPMDVLDFMSSEPDLYRLTPLFNVGIHDIADLKAKGGDGSSGWVACTTDDILATKRDLFDIVVKIPEASSTTQEWPKLTTNDDKTLLATQRDLRRYNSLQRELLRMRRRRSWRDQYRDEEDQDDLMVLDDESEDIQPLMRSITSLVPEQQLDAPEVENESSITEPPSWASIAYSSFLWWASAGERSTARDEEADQDASLVDSLIITTTPPSAPQSPALHHARHRSNSSAKRWKRSSTTSLGRLISGQDDDDDAERQLTTAERSQESCVLIAYFHRLTTLLMEGVDDVVDEENEGSAEDEGSIQLNAEEMTRLGLDVWSEADSRFVSELGRRWWNRDIRWSGRGIELCGVRIC